VADVCFYAIAFCFCAYCLLRLFYLFIFPIFFCEMGGQDEFFNYILFHKKPKIGSS